MKLFVFLFMMLFTQVLTQGMICTYKSLYIYMVPLFLNKCYYSQSFFFLNYLIIMLQYTKAYLLLFFPILLFFFSLYIDTQLIIPMVQFST